MHKYSEIDIFKYLSSIVNLTCTPSDRQMHPQEYMYPRLGTSAPAQNRVAFGVPNNLVWQSTAHERTNNSNSK